MVYLELSKEWIETIVSKSSEVNFQEIVSFCQGSAGIKNDVGSKYAARHF